MSIILIFLAIIFILAGIASAAKIKGILKLTAKVPMMCTFVAISSVNFGSYVGNNTYSTGSMSINCSEGIDFTISLGTGGSGTYKPRQMNNGSNLLDYNLYTDNTYATIWEYNSVNGIGTGGDQNYTIYGRILAGQYVPAGSYSDNIVITIEY
ncbi:MAG: spore coat U domain-containing protein [bacterium]|nr:spore coat U domain-containing protein [bacterium]